MRIRSYANMIGSYRWSIPSQLTQLIAMTCIEHVGSTDQKQKKRQSTILHAQQKQTKIYRLIHQLRYFPNSQVISCHPLPFQTPFHSNPNPNFSHPFFPTPKNQPTAILQKSMILYNLPLLNYFRITMKRTKQDHSSNPISLSSKRNSLQPQKYTTPQKNEWTAPLQTVDNTHNKSLYTHMKAELTNIKNDFQRLIQREEKAVGLGTKQKEIIELKNAWHTGSKGKSYTNFKSDGGAILFDRTPDIDTFDHLIKNKDVIDPSNKIFSLTKNINEAVNFKNKHVANKDKESINNPISKYIALNQKDNEVKESNYASLNAKKQSSNGGAQGKEKQLQAAKMEIARQKGTIDQLEKDCAGLKDEKTKISEYFKTLKQKYGDSKSEVLSKDEKIKEDSELIAQLKTAIQSCRADKEKLTTTQKEFQQLHSSILKERQQISNERNFYTQKLNELTFYNSNFYQENMRLTEENQMLKETIAQLQRLIEDNKRINFESEKDYQRKMDHLQRNIAEYEKREHMLQAEIERLYAELNSKGQTINNEQVQQFHKIEGNPSSIEEQILHLRQELSRQREINELISKKYKEEFSKLNIEELTRTFQTSIQALTDENIQLKNSRNAAQSKIQELQEKIYCFQSEIALYQERERDSKASRSLSSCEWQEMMEKIERLQAENKRLIEEKEYREICKEVKQQGKEAENEMKEEYSDLLRIVKDQLEEINSLQQSNKKLKEGLHLCNQQLQLLKNSKIHLQDQLWIMSQYPVDASLSDLLAKHQTLSSQLQRKTQTISHLKKILFSLLERKQLHPTEQQQKYYASAVTTLASL